MSPGLLIRFERIRGARCYLLESEKQNSKIKQAGQNLQKCMTSRQCTPAEVSYLANFFILFGGSSPSRVPSGIPRSHADKVVLSEFSRMRHVTSAALFRFHAAAAFDTPVWMCVPRSAARTSSLREYFGPGLMVSWWPRDHRFDRNIVSGLRSCSVDKL